MALVCKLIAMLMVNQDPLSLCSSRTVGHSTKSHVSPIDNVHPLESGWSRVDLKSDMLLSHVTRSHTSLYKCRAENGLEPAIETDFQLLVSGMNFSEPSTSGKNLFYPPLVLSVDFSQNEALSRVHCVSYLSIELHQSTKARCLLRFLSSSFLFYLAWSSAVSINQMSRSLICILSSTSVV